MKKIVRTSGLLKWTAMLICGALPLIEAGYWITNGYSFFAPFFQVDPLPIFGDKQVNWQNLDETQKFLGFLINMLPLAFTMAALVCLSQLFAAFERFELFEKRNVKILKQAGWALVLGQMVHPFYEAFLSLALTYRNPVGERVLSVGFGSHQIAILAIGLSILLASWVFEEAAKIKEEQTGTI